MRLLSCKSKDDFCSKRAEICRRNEASIKAAERGEIRSYCSTRFERLVNRGLKPGSDRAQLTTKPCIRFEHSPRQDRIRPDQTRGRNTRPRRSPLASSKQVVDIVWDSFKRPPERHANASPQGHFQRQAIGDARTCSTKIVI